MSAVTGLDPDWRRPAPDARGFRGDAIIAAALLVGALISSALYVRIGLYAHPAPWWQIIIWSVLLCGPLAWRRRFPATVATIITAAFIVGGLFTVPEALFNNIALFLALYSIGAWSANRTQAMVSRGGLIAAMFVWLFAILIIGPGDESTLSTAGAMSPYLSYGLISIIINLLYFSAAYFFGESAYRTARQRAALEARTAELFAEREISAAQAVTLERVRIARELHDVVAHHVSIMGVQAGAARRVLRANADQAESALSTIEVSARTAVDELHQLLGALRSDEHVDTPNQSISTLVLGQLSALAAEATHNGLPVTYILVGDPFPVPATVQLCAYRVAQEALTNTRKHGGFSASAELRLRYLDSAVEIEVTDTGNSGATSDSAPRPHSGLGQQGMRERVATVGGTLELRHKARGGYLVRARFPVGEPDTTTSMLPDRESSTA